MIKILCLKNVSRFFTSLNIVYAIIKPSRSNTQLIVYRCTKLSLDEFLTDKKINSNAGEQMSHDM